MTYQYRRYGVLSADPTKVLTRAQALELIVAAYGLDEHAADIADSALPGYANDSDPITLFTDDLDTLRQMIVAHDVDFLYDFKSGVIMIDLFGHHELSMGYLYRAIRDWRAETTGEAADRYVEMGYGCFKSSMSNNIHIGSNVARPKIPGTWTYL